MAVRPWLCLILLLPMICGCLERENERPAAGVQTASANVWLDPDAHLLEEQRLLLPQGIDLRQAGYVLDEKGLRILCQLRDYSARTEGRPDPQRLIAFAPGATDYDQIELHDNENPVLFLRRPQGGVLLTVSDPAQNHADGPGLRQLFVSASDAKRIGLLRSDLLPVGFTRDAKVALRQVSKVDLRRGLLHAKPDWSKAVQYLDLASAQLSDAAEPLFASGSGDAGYNVRFDTAVPEKAQIEYFWSASADGKRLKRWTAPYYASSRGPDWQPPLLWLDDGNLATIAFLPGSTVEKRAGRGVFRLVTLNAATGAATLAEDHLPADLPIRAAGSAVIYTRMVPSDDGRRGKSGVVLLMD